MTDGPFRIRRNWREIAKRCGTRFDFPTPVAFTIMLLAVVGFVAYRVTSPEQREQAIEIGIAYLRQLRIVITEPGPEHEAFFDALRRRTPHLLVTPAIIFISAQLFIAMRFGAAPIGDPATLVAWGASLGTLTTNGGWWRLVSSTFVHTSTIHLVVGIAALIQVGRILERVVGRLTVAAVYLSAGVFTGLVNLSSHPLAVTVGTSGAVFGLYGLLIALLIWQTFYEWRGTWQTQADAVTTVSEAKAGAEPHVLDTLQLQLDRPQLATWTPAGVAPADHLRQDYGSPPKRQVMAEAGPPPLDPSWGLPAETPGPAIEPWSPAVVGPADHLRQDYGSPPKRQVKAEAGPPPLDASWGLPAETPGRAIEPWSPAVVGPAVETWDPAVEASSPAIATWGPAAETSGPALAGPTTTVPLVAMKRIGAGAAVFLLYSAFSGFAGAAEFTGLLVGLMYGLVLARGAGEQEPTRRHIGFATAATTVVAVVCAVALRNIADVKPEIARLLATEERTAAAYRAGFDALKKGRMTAETLAQLAERSIIPELQTVDARLKALTNVPPEHQPLVADAREYLRLRCASWRAYADVVRRTGDVPKRAPGAAANASWRLQAEARFRSNRAAAGSAEGAERASLEAFQRIKQSALP